MTERSGNHGADHIELTRGDVAALVALGTGPRLDTPDGTLAELFEGQVTRTPDGCAVVVDGRTLSYARLNTEANQLAHYLRSQTPTVKPETVIGVCLPRSEHMLVSILAVLKAGAAYLPLDPDYPSSRLAYMIDDAHATAVITHTDLKGAVAATEASTFYLDQHQRHLREQPSHNLHKTVKPHNLAYVIYTSGSTGRPKGVMVEHRNIVNYLLVASDVTRPLASDRVAQIVSPAFDPALRETLGALLVGASVHLLPNGRDRGPRALARLFASGEITVAAAIVPSLLTQMILCAENERLEWPLRVVATAGEALPSTLVDRLMSIAPTAEIFNQYGPAESTMVSTRYGVQRDSTRRTKVPVGRPVANVAIYVMPEPGRLAERGTVGEIVIGGSGVGRGYLNQPDLTAERFVPDPFGSPGRRLYRTGDLGRWLPDGNLEFMGRMDDQIKIRGFRVEPGEVETRLCQYPAIHDALVTAREGPAGPRLVAYVRGTRDPVARLRKFLEHFLPAYMIPSSFVWLDEFPLTPNGKVDRRGLPDPEDAEVNLTGYVPPSNDMEMRIAGIWAEALGVERVGIYDNFLDLGGHSLLAARILNRVEDSTGVAMSIKNLADHPTVARSSAFIQSHASRRAGGSAMEAPTPEVRGRCLSFAQQRLWFLHQLDSDSPLYNMSTSIALHGDLDVVALTQAMQDVVTLNPVLRTLFRDEDGIPAIVEVPSQTIDFSQAAAPSICVEAEPWIADQIASEASRPFSLSRGPLVRFRLYRITDTRNVLTIVYHHIVMDGWSVELILEQLAEFYGKRRHGLTPTVPDSHIEYTDFTAWERSHASAAKRYALPYWKHELADGNYLIDLPNDRPRARFPSHRGNVVRLPISQRTVARLRSVGRSGGSTLFVAALAGFAVLLSRYTDKNDFIIGTPSAGRSRSEFESVLGFFSNTLPIRVRLAGTSTYEDLLADLRRRVVEGYSHENAPFQWLVQELSIDRNAPHNPLVQVIFLVTERVRDRSHLCLWEGLQASKTRSPVTHVRFDIELHLDCSDGSPIVELLYSSEMFDHETAVRMASSYVDILNEVGTNPRSRIRNTVPGKKS